LERGGQRKPKRKRGLDRKASLMAEPGPAHTCAEKEKRFQKKNNMDY